MKKSALFSTLFIALAALFLSSQIIFAQSAALAESSLTAIPPRLGEDLSLKVKPGEKIQTSVRVRNGSSETLTVQSLAQDFIVDLNGETPTPINDQTSNRWSLASWVVLTPSVQEILTGETAIINVIIEAPSDALPGGHYAMITHQPNLGGSKVNPALTLAHSSAATLQQRVGTLLYVTVEGPINEAAFIRGLTIPKFTELGPVPFSFMIDNQSDIHIRPQIGVEIYNLFGRKIETINLETKNVFPFIARDFAGQWDRIWGFGPYTAKVVMSYGSTGQLAVATASFWLLPITLLLALLIVLLTIVAIVIVIRRHLLHRRDDQRAKIEMLETKVSQLEQEKLRKFDK
ncbi:DUF916 domain-containing protein [Patescibacteria group bacterium]|nr:DUF916 domain-containing protein [Patescibacteria group bacterium]MBU1967201.1 DUF916 domain-containing protein [Patescibacteria group bacterium]MBU2542948.1 DUF916 domain-containing protein [Patescibacteria group bacterium]